MAKNNKNNNKKRQTKKKSKSRSKKHVSRSFNNPLGLSPCAMHYALAIAKPFHPKASGACVPTFPARLTQKVSAKMVGTMHVGASGFIAYAPCLANDQACIYYSNTNTYGGDGVSISLPTMPAGSTFSTFSTLPYSNTQFLDGTSSTSGTLKGRIVSTSIRIRYVGTELNRGGVIYGLVRPDHENINNMSVATLASYKECIKQSVGRQWVELVASAVDPRETVFYDTTGILASGAANAGALEFIETMFPFSQSQCLSSTNTTNGAPIMAFAVTGVSGNTYEWEIIQHCEYIGSPTQSVATRSHADAEGLSTITEIAGNIPSERQAGNLSQAEAFVRGAMSFASEHRETLASGIQVAAELFAPRSMRGVRTGSTSTISYR